RQGGSIRRDGAVERKVVEEMAAPPFTVTSVHGVAPDVVYAAGYDGKLARWNGRAWRSLQTPTGEPLNQVFVASEDEVHACAKQVVVGGPPAKLEIVVENERAYFTGVAKWKGDLWMAAGGSPWRRTAAGTAQIEVPIEAWSLEARENLIILA